MKLNETRPVEEMPTTVQEYIDFYGIRTGPFLPLKFNLPNMVASCLGTPFMVFDLDFGCTKINSLEGLKVQYASNVSFLKCPLRNYHDIHKHLRDCDTIHVYLHATHMLGLFKCVKKPSSVFPNRIRLYDEGDKLDARATQLFNDLHSKDLTIYDIQEALVDAGFSEDQANL